MADLSAVEKLARYTMEEHGLVGWKFEWDRAVRRWGCCHHTDRKITMSAPLTKLNIDKEAEIRDIILHEIAHALVGGRAGHGPVWKRKAKEIGARPERCYSSVTVAAVPHKWEAKCPSCGQTWKRHRKTADLYCGKCKAWLAWTRITWLY